MASQNVSLGAERGLTRGAVGQVSRGRVRDRLSHGAIYLTLIACSILIALPFLWMISTSLKRPGTEFLYPVQWIPSPPRWGNYPAAWTVMPFNTWAINTIMITGLATIGHVASCALIAFGFARINFPGRNALFILVLATMMVPYPAVIVPLFILYKNLGWIDTFLPLIIPAYFGVNAFFIFLLRQFFKTVPMDLDDAARIDGCSTFGVFWHIALPLIRPALGVVLVFSFMHHWNDFLAPLIYLSSTEKFTLAMGLRFFQGQDRVEWTLLMAASLIVVAPCIVLFFIAQKYYIQGIVISGVKG
jgi:ABC-type glycerol-3-phosphate transport system permease component